MKTYFTAYNWKENYLILIKCKHNVFVIEPSAVTILFRGKATVFFV